MMELIEAMLNKIKSSDDISEPPYDYEFILKLNPKDYPKYLKKMFKSQTGENLNLKNPKTFNEKIQWIKLYDSTPLKTQLTDKVLVRDWVKEKIGEQYLKPLLWAGKSFDEIPFEAMPESFIIKCNHGCKWHFKIKEKSKFLNTKELYLYVKSKFDNWIMQTFFPWAGFEMQYKNIIPQILIEPLLVEENKDFPIEYEIYCFNGQPKLFQQIEYKIPAESSIFDENYQKLEIKLNPSYVSNDAIPEELLKKAVKLSKKLAKNFRLVRVDWLQYRNQIYFNEMTFTPFSGFFQFENKEWNKKLGSMLNLK